MRVAAVVIGALEQMRRNKEVVAMGYLTRTPTSNDPPRARSNNPWLEETEMMDEVALILGGYAKRCATCKRPARLKYLDEDRNCPDCRESP